MQNYFVTLILFSFLTVACTTEPADVQVPLEEEQALLEDERLEAINTKILADPNNHVFYYERALYFIDQQDLVAAQKDIERTMAIDSTVAEYHKTFGDLLYMQGKIGLSRSAFERCVELDPEHIEGLLKLGEIAFLVQDYKKSLSYLDRVLKADVNEPKAYYMKGFVFKEKGDTVRAASSFQTAIEQNPDLYDAHIQLGLLYASAHKDLAIDYYNNAIRINPRGTDALYNKGHYCQNHGYYNEAIASYQQLVTVDSTYAEAWHNLGYVNMQYLDAYDEAVGYFTKAIEVRPNYLEAWYNRGLAYELAKDMANAEADYRQVLKMKPDYDNAARGISRVRGEG